MILSLGIIKTNSFKVENKLIILLILGEKKMKKRYYFLISFIILSVGIWFFGSTTHSNLEGKDAEKLEEFMEEKAKEVNFNGTVLVTKDGKVILSKGYGYADQDKKIKNTPETVFHIASLSKSFTALSILQLEEKGELSTNDTISNYFPDFPNGEKIKIHHLLNHTSGLPELLTLVKKDEEHSLEELYNAVKESKLDFEPGEKYAYSNSGYLLLALILEQQSEMTMADYMQKNILEPAGMEHTYFVTSPEGVAVGYENMGKPTDIIDISIAYGSGNILSTTSDLLLFEQAINNGKLLSKETVKKMQEPSTNAAPFGIVKYAYGWNVSDSWYSFNHRAVAHSGGFTGFRNFFLRFPDDGVTVIILSNNQSDLNVGGLSLEIASIILKERFWYIINKL
jgi:CubicO group peptidase (beta-lactamase class C family)